jgi:hypothetical protein
LLKVQAEEYGMSKNNNVNPGQYKVAGRERQGENLGQNKDKQAMNAPIPGQNVPPERSKHEKTAPEHAADDD